MPWNEAENAINASVDFVHEKGLETNDHFVRNTVNTAMYYKAYWLTVGANVTCQLGQILTNEAKSSKAPGVRFVLKKAHGREGNEFL